MWSGDLNSDKTDFVFFEEEREMQTRERVVRGCSGIYTI